MSTRYGYVRRRADARTQYGRQRVDTHSNPQVRHAIITAHFNLSESQSVFLQSCGKTKTVNRTQKTDFCDACFEPWYARIYDADGEPMENICDDCRDLIEDGPAGLSEDDERPPICSCGVTMAPVEDDDEPAHGVG